MSTVNELRDFVKSIDAEKYSQVFLEDAIVELRKSHPNLFKEFTWKIPNTSGSCGVYFLSNTVKNVLMTYFTFQCSMPLKDYMDALLSE